MLTLLLLLGAGSPRPADPHGDPKGCVACHVVDGDRVGDALPVVPTCRGCHPTADMHPVGVLPAEVRVEDGFPLQEGRLSCWTCHVEPAHERDEAVPRPYHREGPYEPVTTLCYRCHDRETFTRTNPHHPAAPRSPDDESCVACHRVNPEAGAPPHAAGLRAAAGEACDTCHEGEPHAGAGDHRGKTVPAGMVVPPELPLDRDGSIACWTCHEVHDAAPVATRGERGRRLRAAIRGLSGATGRGRDEARDTLLVLPADDATLCRACHGDGP